MSLTLRRLCAALSVGLLAAPASAQAPPAWPQFQGGPAHVGAVEGAGLRPPFARAWTFHEPGSDRGLSGPIVAGDVAVAVGVEAVFAVDPATGRERWSVPRARGPLASPAVGAAGGGEVLVFTEGEEASDSRVVAVDLEARSVRWRVSLDEVSGSGVTVDGGRAFVGDRDGRVYALDLSAGDLLWTAEVDGRIDTPPAASNGRVYVIAANRSTGAVRVVALEADSGEVAWSFARAGGGFGTGLSVAGGTVVVGTADRLVRGLDAGSGEERWAGRARTLFSPLTAPAFVDGEVVIADAAAGLYVLDGDTGDRLWDFQFDAQVERGAPVVVDGLILLGLDDGRLAAVDRGTRNLVWEGRTGPGGLGPIAAGPGVVLVSKGGKEGGLVAFRHDPRGRRISVPSPTVLDLPMALVRYAVAFVLVFGAALVLARVLPTAARRRAGRDD